MSDAVKLKIALEALLELEAMDEADADLWASQIVANALRSIQREHYPGSPSPVVAEVLRGVWV